MLQWQHSAILSTFIKLSFVIKIFVLTTFEWPLKTGLTVFLYLEFLPLISDTKLEQNQVAGFLTLLRNMIQTRPTNQDSFVRTNGAAIIGALLQKVRY